jgi:hypothetical protein
MESDMKSDYPRIGLFLGLTLLAMFAVPLNAAADNATPNPLDLYRSLNGHMASVDTYSVHIEKQFDVIRLDGAKVLYSGALDVLVSREGGLHIDYGDDISAKEVWYDGSALTIMDHLENVYVRTPAAGRVNDMVVDVNERFGLELPLAPLLEYTKPDDFEAAVQSATYLGLHDAAGESCHHALYRGANIDLQLWIATGDKPLLRKMVVTFWNIEGGPQQSLVFSDWDLKPEIDRRSFEADIPDGAVRTEVLPRGEQS